jgi:integrase
MARKARNERLETRAARLRLAVRREPYFHTIQEGRALGYRRLAGSKSGTWIARHYERDRTPRNLFQALGSADDYLDADGADALTYHQALDAAAAWFASLSRGPTANPINVADATARYMAHYRAKGGKAERETLSVIDAHILPKLGTVRVDALTTGIIKAWRDALATAPARLRADASGKRKSRPAIDSVTKRARRSTANRIMTVLKAILNLAYRDGLAASDDAWRRVQPFANVDAAKVRYLTDDEAARLVNACNPSFRWLVVAALLTGCRYGELCNLRADDLDLANGRATVRESKASKPRVVTLTSEAVRLFEQAAVGKSRAALVLARDDGEPWGKSHQSRRLADACRAASIAPSIGFHILRHTHASRLAMAGTPMSVIAAQLGNSEAICAKHYAHLSPSYVADAVRAGFSDMGIVAETSVRSINKARA